MKLFLLTRSILTHISSSKCNKFPKSTEPSVLKMRGVQGLASSEADKYRGVTVHVLQVTRSHLKGLLLAKCRRIWAPIIRSSNYNLGKQSVGCVSALNMHINEWRKEGRKEGRNAGEGKLLLTVECWGLVCNCGRNAAIIVKVWWGKTHQSILNVEDQDVYMVLKSFPTNLDTWET